jgi:hypothetical protein
MRELFNSVLSPLEKKQEPLSGVIVCTCGPLELKDAVLATVASIDSSRVDRLGGVQFFAE